jgi:uncharacterized RDD family membrane protein YckC
MQCPRCQWNNPGGSVHCFNCHSPLGEAHLAKPPLGTAAEGASAQADLGSRYLATLIDAVFSAAAVGVVVLVYVFGLNGLPGTGSGDGLLASLLVALGLLVLPGVLDAYGGSVGRRVMGIAVVRPDGAPLNPLLGVWRHLLKYAFGLGMPFIGSLIARVLFGSRFLHEWFVRAQVVRSETVPQGASGGSRKPADPNDFAAMLEARQPLPNQTKATAIATATATATPDAPSAQPAVSRWRRMKPVVLGAIALFFVLPLLSAGWSIWSDLGDPGKQLIGEVKRSQQPLLDRLGLYAKAQGRYPQSMAELAGSGETPQGVASHPAIDQLTFDPGTGVLTVRLAAAPFEGKHVLFKPRPARATVKAVRWDCGSTDIPRHSLPSDCANEWSPEAVPSLPAKADGSP